VIIIILLLVIATLLLSLICKLTLSQVRMYKRNTQCMQSSVLSVVSHSTWNHGSWNAFPEDKSKDNNKNNVNKIRRVNLKLSLMLLNPDTELYSPTPSFHTEPSSIFRTI
jgi:hypothetical protein